MIGNVFYNLLNHVGQEKRDPQLAALSQQMKDMM